MKFVLYNCNDAMHHSSFVCFGETIHMSDSNLFSCGAISDGAFLVQSE
jgi:hypothetical protein